MMRARVLGWPYRCTHRHLRSLDGRSSAGPGGAIIAAIGGVEYARMCRTKAWTPSQPLISVGSALFVVDAVANNGAYCGPLLALVLVFSLGRQVLGATPTGSMAVPPLEVFGVVYCGWTLSRFCLIRGHLARQDWVSRCWYWCSCGLTTWVHSSLAGHLDGASFLQGCRLTRLWKVQ